MGSSYFGKFRTFERYLRVKTAGNAHENRPKWEKRRIFCLERSVESILQVSVAEQVRVSTGPTQGAIENLENGPKTSTKLL